MKHLVDVSELEAPQPMERVLDTLIDLKTGDWICMQHRMEPFPLYPILTDLGFAHLTLSIDSPGYQILIWRQNDDLAEQALRKENAITSC